MCVKLNNTCGMRKKNRKNTGVRSKNNTKIKN